MKWKKLVSSKAKLEAQRRYRERKKIEQGLDPNTRKYNTEYWIRRRMKSLVEQGIFILEEEK
jgi:hypothetical protein